MFGLGVLLLLYGSFFWRQSPAPTITAVQTTPVETTTIRPPLPIRIKIASLIDLPIEEAKFAASGWEVSDTAASIASMSARPGEAGNIIIYSHNLTRLFGRLTQVKIADTIELWGPDGDHHTYTVTKKIVLDPNEIDVLRPTDQEVLTLYTCTGLFDRKRLVIQAVPIKS